LPIGDKKNSSPTHKTKKIVPKKEEEKSTKVARFPGINFSEIFYIRQ